MIRYRRQRWLTPDGHTLVALLPVGIEGHFGPELHRFVLLQHHQGQVTTERITAFLNSLGMAISKLCNDNLHDRWATMRMAGLRRQSRRKMWSLRAFLTADLTALSVLARSKRSGSNERPAHRRMGRCSSGSGSAQASRKSA